MNDIFIKLEQFEELNSEMLEGINGGGIFENIYNWLHLHPEPRACFVPRLLTR